MTSLDISVIVTEIPTRIYIQISKTRTIYYYKQKMWSNNAAIENKIWTHNKKSDTIIQSKNLSCRYVYRSWNMMSLGILVIVTEIPTRIYIQISNTKAIYYCKQKCDQIMQLLKIKYEHITKKQIPWFSPKILLAYPYVDPGIWRHWVSRWSWPRYPQKFTFKYQKQKPYIITNKKCNQIMQLLKIKYENITKKQIAWFSPKIHLADTYVSRWR